MARVPLPNTSKTLHMQQLANSLPRGRDKRERWEKKSENSKSIRVLSQQSVRVLNLWVLPAWFFASVLFFASMNSCFYLKSTCLSQIHYPNKTRIEDCGANPDSPRRTVFPGVASQINYLCLNPCLRVDYWKNPRWDSLRVEMSDNAVSY